MSSKLDIETFIEKKRVSPEQHRQAIGESFTLPDGWTHDEGNRIQAPISWFENYVVSHRGDINTGGQGHILSFRPPREHHHVGRYPTANDAFDAARQHKP